MIVNYSENILTLSFLYIYKLAQIATYCITNMYSIIIHTKKIFYIMILLYVCMLRVNEPLCGLDMVE